MTAALTPEDVEALYAQTLDRFVAARAELVTRLKTDGNTQGAKDAQALRKPTVAAWAVDRLARDQPKDLAELLEAGSRLQTAQERAVAGKGVAALHETGRDRRRIVDRLVSAAATILEDSGLSSARSNLDKVADTLMAVASNETAADRVRRGILDRELPAPAGFGEPGDEGLERLLAASASGTGTQQRRSSSQAGGGVDRRQRQARERVERLAAEAAEEREEAARLQAEADEAEARARRATREAERAKKAASEARTRADRAARRAEQAGTRLSG